jgi:MFS family permease
MTDTTFPVGATVAEAEHRAHLRRAVVASTVGTTIEWYDFLIYSTMTGLVFGHVFFAGSDPLIDTLKAFGVFFIGFVARPIGAAIFGLLRDRRDEKRASIRMRKCRRMRDERRA